MTTQDLNIKHDAAKSHLEMRKTKLREAAVGYVTEAALFGQTNSDGMAELEDAASEYHAAYIALRNVEAEMDLTAAREEAI